MAWVWRSMTWLLTTALLLVAPHVHAATSDEIARRGTVRICTAADARPFSYIDASGRFRGFLPSLIDTLRGDLAAKLGEPLRAELVRTTPLNRIAFLNGGRCDLMLSSFAATPQRSRLVDFVDPPFYASRAALLAPSGSGLTRWAQLRGQTVCAPASSAWVPLLEQRYGIRVASYPTIQDSQMAVMAGLCRGIVMDDVIMRAMLAAGPIDGLRPALPPQQPLPWAIAVRKGDRELAVALGGIVAAWHADGTLTRLQTRWAIPAPPQAPAMPSLHPSGGGLDFTFLADRAERGRLLEGMASTMALALATLPLVLIVGLALLWLAEHSRSAAGLVEAYAAWMRATPVLAQLYLIYFGLNGYFAARDLTIPPFLCAAAALTLHYGAFVADILRGALTTARGMVGEAAAALGLSRHQQFRHGFMPIAARMALPALGNVAVQIIKATTIAYAIAVPELLYSANRVWSQGGSAAELMLVLLAFFLIVCSAATASVRAIERRFAMPGYGHAS